MKKFVSSFAAATFAILALTFVACKNNSETAATASETTATTAPLAETTTTTTTTETANATVSNSGNATTTPITQAATAPTGPTTSIEFKEVEYDYGTIKAGEKAVHIYKFKNTGKEPLIISDAKGSCGCTVPQWPKEPIAPGKEGDIKVEFDSKGKNGPQSKRVTLTANTNPAQSFLTIKGIVKGDPNASAPAVEATPKKQ